MRGAVSMASEIGDVQDGLVHGLLWLPFEPEIHVLSSVLPFESINV